MVKGEKKLKRKPSNNQKNQNKTPIKTTTSILTYPPSFTGIQTLELSWPCRPSLLTVSHKFWNSRRADAFIWQVENEACMQACYIRTQQQCGTISPKFSCSCFSCY